MISEPNTGSLTWIPDRGDTSIRHRHGVPWWSARMPHRWHACRPQTARLYHDGGLLSGTCYCACGAVTDDTGRWVGCNSRRHAPDPAGLRRERPTSQPVRAWVAAGTTPHPGSRRHPRTHQARPA